MSPGKRLHVVVVMAILMLVVLLHGDNIKVDAAKYIVGDSAGWSTQIGNWSDGKTFKAGDILVFDYPSPYHNVVVVDKEGYDGCGGGSGTSQVYYNSGHDEIELVKGCNYFICDKPGHCSLGQKMTITAL